MRIVLVSVALLIVALATVGFLHPDGPSGLLAMVRGGSEDADRGPAPVVAEKPLAQKAEEEIEKGHRAYDQGDFSLAVTFYGVARGVAQSDHQRLRALKAYQKALLGDVLTRNALPDDAASFEQLRREAEGTGSERAWFEALRSGAGARRKAALPYILEQCLAAATRGGEVERMGNELVRGGGREGIELARALRAHGLDARSAPGEDPEADDEVDDTGGILGARHGRRPGMPFGTFSKTTRAKIRKALDLESEGMREYELASPDRTDRETHRRKSLDLLQQARDIYDAALTEDPKSQDLELRYSAVIRTIAALRKDLSAMK